MIDLAAVPLQHDEDVVSARRRAAELAELLGFESQDQTRIATAVSEIARNAQRYAGGGRVVYALDVEAQPQALVVTVEDRGPGIPHLDMVLSGRDVSAHGLGAGILGSRRLMDTLLVETTVGRGTRVTMRRNLPDPAPVITTERLTAIRRAIADRTPVGLVEECQRQNHELLRALAELKARQEELLRLNREIEETNRGVVALYAELDDRAEHLRAAADLKARFHSNMTHEFRTPVLSIVGLCDLLEKRRQAEGLSSDPELGYIRDSARHLSGLVDDLLDMAKTDAGKSDVREEPVEISELFGTLRGMLRPLLPGERVALVFDQPDDLPVVTTDAGKVSQILRNLISNALKFTERGEIRVSARIAADNPEMIDLAVSDTGIGIDPADHERIFEEFLQLDARSAGATRGTGLGLPLSRRLAHLLGGTVSVRSRRHGGATFTLRLPIRRS